MKPSILELLNIAYHKIGVELDAKHPTPPSENQNPAGQPVYSFDNVPIKTGVGVLEFNTNQGLQLSEGRFFKIEFELIIDNEIHEQDESPNFSPYLIHVCAVAIFRVVPGTEKLGDAQDIATVNGSSIVWGSIRDQIATLTARMPAGMALLPSVHFQDLKQPTGQKTSANPDAGATPARKVRRTKAS